MEILIKQQALVKFLEEVAEAYRSLRPAEYQEFLRIIEEESHSLIKPSAMTRDGSALNFMKVPTSVYLFIKREYRRRFEDADFFADVENYYLLAKVWPAIRVRRKETQMLRVRPTDF